jgi:hypothetical protein
MTVTGPSFPRDVWFCAELQLDLGTAGHAQHFVDGTRVIDVPNTNTVLPSGISYLRVGVTIAQDAADVFVDDVIVATAPIGC